MWLRFFNSMSYVMNADLKQHISWNSIFLVIPDCYWHRYNSWTMEFQKFHVSQFQCLHLTKPLDSSQVKILIDFSRNAETSPGQTKLIRTHLITIYISEENRPSEIVRFNITNRIFLFVSSLAVKNKGRKHKIVFSYRRRQLKQRREENFQGETRFSCKKRLAA